MKSDRGRGTAPLVLSRERLKQLIRIERSLGVRFKDRGLLDRALTHPSFSHEKAGENNGHYERLEFMGDAVLELTISHILYSEHPEKGEGYLTRARADLVNKNRLAQLAARLDLGSALKFGKGEKVTGGWLKASILSAAFEATIGALYLDGGFKKAFRVVNRLFEQFVKDQEIGLRDPRSSLQEWTQKHYRTIPEYVVIEAAGPGHERVFKVAVDLKGERLAVAKGPSKKEAGKRAALKALQIVMEREKMEHGRQ